MLSQATLKKSTFFYHARLSALGYGSEWNKCCGLFGPAGGIQDHIVKGIDCSSKSANKIDNTHIKVFDTKRKAIQWLVRGANFPCPVCVITSGHEERLGNLNEANKTQGTSHYLEGEGVQGGRGRVRKKYALQKGLVRRIWTWPSLIR